MINIKLTMKNGNVIEGVLHETCYLTGDCLSIDDNAAAVALFCRRNMIKAANVASFEVTK